MEVTDIAKMFYADPKKLEEILFRDYLDDPYEDAALDLLYQVYSPEHFPNSLRIRSAIYAQKLKRKEVDIDDMSSDLKHLLRNGDEVRDKSKSTWFDKIYQQLVFRCL